MFNLVIFFMVSYLIYCLFNLLKHYFAYLKYWERLFKSPIHQILSLERNTFFIFSLLKNKLSLLIYLIKTMYFRNIISPFPKDILTHISSLFLTHQPFISLYIVKVNISTRISHIASDSVREKQTVMHFDIFNCYISHCNSRLSLTYTFSKWIEHAAWTISIWFFHLLRTDIDSPPNRLIHCKIQI